MNPTDPSPSPQAADIFVTTRWSVVLAAGRKSSPQSAVALSALCEAYWYPLYVYVRGRGHSREDAEDLVQGFFAALLARDDLSMVSAERGRFRAYLLASLQHYMANQWDRSRRLKRGGGQTVWSLDWPGVHERFEEEIADTSSPEKAYDRAWALALLERVLKTLADETCKEGRGQWFEAAKGFLTLGDPDLGYDEAARRAGTEPGTLRVWVHRLRKRYRTLLREEIRQTLEDPSQVDEELRSLAAALTV